MRSTPPRSLSALLVATALAYVASAARADDAAVSRSGEQIYRRMCVRCHGATGEGTEEYPRALAGDRTVPQLSRLIAKTMPEDDPGTCTGADADKVAAYLHDAFYSRAARDRNTPPRIELARLTNRQYLNAVADIIGGFREAPQWNAERGLRGEYFNARGFRDDKRVIDRRDPQIKFDFGETGPDADPSKFEPHQFSIRWQGSVLAPDTGDYEFVVRTEHSAKLFVNDNRTPLIDAWVKSGHDTEFRGNVRLLGGRAYPIRLEFSKAKQGVDDSKKQKTPPKPVKATVALLWKGPKGPLEVVPGRFLGPTNSPETLVVATPFPPDDRSVGYERGTSVSRSWDQATTDAAIEVANAVADRLKEFGGPDKAKEFCLKFAARAFRRPLTDEQKALYVERQFTEAKGPEAAVKRSVMLTLKSPRFLYHGIDDGGDGYDVASRLSLGLWDSIPDATLLQAASDGTLKTRDQVVAQAERMSGDLRTRSKLRDFFLQWVRVDQASDISKDPKLYPDFDPTLVADLRTSLELFLDDTIWGESSDFRRLFSSDETFLNGRLARYFGVDLPPDAPFRKVKLDPADRAGLLTHPYLLATFAYTGSTSPIHRGVFLARSVLGRSLKPPPIAVSPLAPDLHAGLNTRERVTLQTSPVNCQSCHNMINPLGFALERFDAVGRLRDKEVGKPVDASGYYQTLDGGTVNFNGARGLADFLVGSEETHAAFVEQMFHHVVKQPMRAYGPRVPADLQKSFAAGGFQVRKLLTDILAVAALPPSTEQPSAATHASGDAASR